MDTELKSRSERLLEIYRKEAPPESEEYVLVIEKTLEILDNEKDEIRPQDGSGIPGGIVLLKETLPTIIVPDIHARMDFFLSVLMYEDHDGRCSLERLERNELQIVCLGDGFHAEGRARERWALAFEEYSNDYSRHKYMDEEMRESLGVMEMVMEAKCWFPENFHFLKGNHENITNEEGEGNHPFRKFSYEGIMVLEYVSRFYGDDFLDSYYEFEKALPLLAVGKNFLVSHAEPFRFFGREEVIEYRSNPEVTEGLTWTANNAAEQESVEEMLEEYIGCSDEDPCYYFGGHRPVNGLYNRRAGGKYVQIHNPGKFVVATIGVDEPIYLERDIKEINNVVHTIADHW